MAFPTSNRSPSTSTTTPPLDGISTTFPIVPLTQRRTNPSEVLLPSSFFMNITWAPTFSSSKGSAGSVLPNALSSLALKIASKVFGLVVSLFMRSLFVLSTLAFIVARRIISS